MRFETLATATFTKTSGVYALCDPRTNRVMYVGQSIDIEYRYRQHCDPNIWDNNPRKRNWTKGLRRAGLKPTLRVLVECDYPESDAEETRLIREFKADGQAEFNRASGGQGNRAVSLSSNSHPDDWFQIGLSIKSARFKLVMAQAEVGRLAGKRAMKKVASAVRALDQLKIALEAEMLAACPEWKNREFSKVFYGDREDETA